MAATKRTYPGGKAKRDIPWSDVAYVLRCGRNVDHVAKAYGMKAVSLESAARRDGYKPVADVIRRARGFADKPEAHWTDEHRRRYKAKKEAATV